MNTNATSAQAINRKRPSEISGDFFDFITLPMIFLVLAVAGVCYWAHESLLETFLHHVELNSIIIGLMLYGMAKIHVNNFLLFRTALYVRLIEKTESEIVPEQKVVDSLLVNLHGAGSLIDIQNTEVAVQRMVHKGFFIISDNDSRLIKSKIGARVRHRFGQISFFAGILISFGLLGTFVGLIQTVSSVGAQMGMVSHALAAGQELSVIDLISGISKPLEGMGTAFGASLFGLGGSMFLGALNYLAGHAQDQFMESLARWLDSRIPHTKVETMQRAEQLAGANKQPQGPAPAVFPSAPSGPPAQAGATNPGYSVEMGTFFALAEDTHRQLRSLGLLLADIGKALQTQQQSVQTMERLQTEQAQHFAALHVQMASMPEALGGVVQALKNWQVEKNQAEDVQTQHLVKLLAQVESMPAALQHNSSQIERALTEVKGAVQSEEQGMGRAVATASAEIQNLLAQQVNILQQLEKTGSAVKTDVQTAGRRGFSLWPFKG